MAPAVIGDEVVGQSDCDGSGQNAGIRAFHFHFRDVNGTCISEADPHFRGKTVILTIGGTRCRNCPVWTPFLVDLYEKFHARRLEIVGSNFEASGDLLEDAPRVASFVREVQSAVSNYAGRVDWGCAQHI